MAVFGPLVDPDWLSDHLGDPGLVVVDCRFVLGDPGAARRGYEEGHIPGAAHLSVDSDLSSEPGERGRHPLPSLAAFQAAARRAGIGARSRVVAYDTAGEGGAARLWWLLRHFGHDDAAVLDGGLSGWKGELASGPEQVRPGDFAAGAPAPGDTATAEEIRAGGLTLLDARAGERYRGEREPVDAVAGHIPGARSVPAAELAPGGRFPAPAAIRERLGGGDLVAYCGSGVTACNLVLAGELAGVGVRLYPGSWSEWSRRGLDVERGE